MSSPLSTAPDRSTSEHMVLLKVCFCWSSFTLHLTILPPRKTSFHPFCVTYLWYIYPLFHLSLSAYVPILSVPIDPSFHQSIMMHPFVYSSILLCVHLSLYHSIRATFLFIGAENSSTLLTSKKKTWRRFPLRRVFGDVWKEGGNKVDKKKTNEKKKQVTKKMKKWKKRKSQKTEGKAGEKKEGKRGKQKKGSRKEKKTPNDGKNWTGWKQEEKQKVRERELKWKKSRGKLKSRGGKERNCCEIVRSGEGNLFFCKLGLGRITVRKHN